MEFQSVNKLLEKSFRENWDRPALSNYKGQDLAYRDVARRIAKLHIAFEQCGLEKGDKVAICSRNQANWGVSFLAALTYGAVPGPILHEFKPGNIHYLVNHSEAKVLFVDDVIWENLSEAEMPGLYVVVQINNFNFLYSKTEEMSQVRQHLNESFGHKYPNNFGPEDLDYYEDKADELAVINYTSGTSGFSKGVMVPYRALFQYRIRPCPGDAAARQQYRGSVNASFSPHVRHDVRVPVRNDDRRPRALPYSSPESEDHHAGICRHQAAHHYRCAAHHREGL